MKPQRSPKSRRDEFPPVLPPVLHINRIAPRRFHPGDRITLHGTGFSAVPAWNQVFIGGYPARVLRVTGTRIEAEVPVTASDSGLVTVAVDGRVSEPVDGELVPKAVEVFCEGLGDSAVEVWGTSLPACVRVERRRKGAAPEVVETWSQLWCGRNRALVPGGAVNSPHVQVSHRIAGWNNYLVYGCPVTGPLVFASVETLVQFVVRRERGADGRMRDVYYFFRNGRWWRVVDPGQKHPDDPDGVDVREDVSDPNFEPAPDEIERRLNEQFFPTGWEEMWREFEERDRVQMQIMLAMLMQMQGMDAEDAELLEKIRGLRRQGKTIDEIWDALQPGIGSMLISMGVGAAAGGIGGRIARNPAARRLFKRFLEKFFGRRRFFRSITRVREDGDSIELDVDERHRPGPGRPGVQGNLNGRVNRDTGMLESDPGADQWQNTTGTRGLATELMEYFIELLKEFARRKGLRKLRIRRIAQTEQGRDMLERAGFRPVPGRTDANGIGYWEKIIDVD